MTAPQRTACWSYSKDTWSKHYSSVHRLCPSPSFSSYTCIVEESVLLLHFSLCFCDIPIYYSLRSVIHLSTCSYPFFFPLCSIFSGIVLHRVFLQSPSPEHCRNRTGARTHSLSSTSSPQFPSCSCSETHTSTFAGWKGYSYFLTSCFFFFNSVLLCLTWHNLVEAKVPNNRGWNALPSLPPNYHFVLSSYLLSKLVLPLLCSVTAPCRMALRL